MKRCVIALDGHDWTVDCFVGYESEDAVFLCQELTAMGCRNDKIREAFEHFMRGGKGCGLTYSNRDERKSLVAIGQTDSRGDMVNTVGHELFHVVAHVCDADGVDMQGEEACYIMGELCEKILKNT